MSISLESCFGGERKSYGWTGFQPDPPSSHILFWELNACMCSLSIQNKHLKFGGHFGSSWIKWALGWVYRYTCQLARTGRHSCTTWPFVTFISAHAVAHYLIRFPGDFHPGQWIVMIVIDSMSNGMSNVLVSCHMLLTSVKFNPQSVLSVSLSESWLDTITICHMNVHWLVAALAQLCINQRLLCTSMPIVIIPTVPTRSTSKCW